MSELKLVGWADFDSDFPTILDDEETLMLKIELLKKELSLKGYMFGGEQHQYSFGCMPVYSDGTGLRFSMRAWGLVMAMVRGDIEGIDYPYMHFYMSIDDAVMPDDIGVDVEPNTTDELTAGVTIGPDQQIMDEAMAFGMPLMTTDKVIKQMMNSQFDE